MKTKTLRWLAAMLLLVSAMVIPARGNAQVKLTFIAGSKPNTEISSETADNLLDGDTKTKFCGPCNEQYHAYVIFQASAPCRLNGYTITTANDNEKYTDRNPKDWKIYGSNDLNTWEVLVSVSNDTKLEPKNYTAYEYTLDAEIADPYIYYKWEITATHGNVYVQASEFSISALVECTYHGGKGDGQTVNDSQLFTTGYNLTLRLNAKRDAVVLTAEFLDEEEATHAYMQNYPEASAIEEVELGRVGDKIFQKEIPLTSFTNRADGVIRFGVKFAFAGGLRVTTPEFFYLDGLGCAERIFTIYHYDDKPEDGAVTTFDGGRILQPIQYKRKFTPGVWETLCVPFEVDSITVTDNDGTYRLHAQYDQDSDPNTPSFSGHFWLREFRKNSVRAEEFQGNWYDIQVVNEQDALPQKNKPYIMRVPKEEDYYADKYITFHGKGYQTIDANYSAPELPAEGKFSYSGNNTMRSWNLPSAYVLDAKGEYFSSDQPVMLQPFECAVNATQATINLYSRLMISSPQITTADGLPSTEYEGGRIYTTMGVLVGTFETLDEEENCVMHLPEGIYIVQRRQAISKIHISK